MVFASFPSDASWDELDFLAARAGVSVEYLCATVKAAKEFDHVSINSPKGVTNLLYPTHDDDFEQVVRVLWDDDFELAIKEAHWDESEHPRDDDGRFASTGGAHASAGIPYGAVVQPIPHVLPTKQPSASEAREELKRQNDRLTNASKPLQDKLERAQDLLKQLKVQQTSNTAQQAALDTKIRQVAKQIQVHRRALRATERKHDAWLRQLLYVVDPTPVNVRLDVRPGYENIVTPITSQHQKDAALTGGEEVRRMVSAKVTVGDMFFEHEEDPTKRSRYWKYRRVKLAADAGTRVVVHEFGHGIEHINPRIRQNAIAFRNSRTQGEPTIPLQQFDPEYGPGERTRKDRFINPYMGKIYPGDQDTEIVTMGMEYFYGDPVTLAEKDPEYFDFIYNTLRGN